VRRGDIVTVAAPGDYGKHRPAIVIQSDWLKATDSILVVLLTSSLVDAPLYRLLLERAHSPLPNHGR
jgi:mRNA interferase MazF